MFESPISNNKDNKIFELSPLLDVPGQKIFFEFLRLIWKFRYLRLKVRSKIEIMPPPPKARPWQKIFF